MADSYLGAIVAVPFDYPPHGWAFCNGQTLAIAQNQALFSLLGTTYGGNGVTTFQLPNLQSRVPIHGARATPSASWEARRRIRSWAARSARTRHG